jgi:hypothetical protein
MRVIGQRARCEAVDMVPYKDDAVAVQCTETGCVILEKYGERKRLRAVCEKHGLASAMGVN